MPRNLNSYDVWILMDGVQLYPFSTHGFDFAQGSFRTLTKRASGNLFLNPDGEVLEIAKMVLYKSDMVAKLKRFLGFGYSIRVELRRRELDLAVLKEMLVQGLERYRKNFPADESWPFAMQPFSVSKSAIMEAESAGQLLKVLSLPSPLDCLDLL